MKIVWDEPKRLQNIKDHRLDFADLTPEFFETALMQPVRLDRMAALNRFRGKPVMVIFKPLGTEAVSVISMYVKTRAGRMLPND